MGGNLGGKLAFSLQTFALAGGWGGGEGWEGELARIEWEIDVCG